MKVKKQYVQNRSSTYPGVNARKYITIHETGNRKKGADAQAHANLQQNGYQASWHWQVDDKVAIQSYPHTVKCWHAGDGKGTGNSASIAIEICVNRDGNYEQAVENAITLTKQIMKEENIAPSQVVQHHFWSGKNCPALLRSGAMGIHWASFKRQIEESQSIPQRMKSMKKYGERGEHVLQLQRQLRRLGYLIEADRSFGHETLFAIRLLQARHRLEVDGIAGPKTNAMIDNLLQTGKVIPIRVLQYGQRAEAVAVLQELFNRLHIKLVIDYSFGLKTLQAVRTFQEENRLVIDGFVGPLTWEVLHKSLYQRK